MWIEICNVNGCERPAVNDVAGWPRHKENVHRYFHENGCPYCGSEDHCLSDCESAKKFEALLNKLFGPVV